MIEAGKDLLINVFLILMVGIITTFIMALVKKGEFYNIGFTVGKFLSRTGSLRFGKINWEKIEDALITSFVSFSEGVKSGADSDDGNLTITSKK